MYYGHLNKIILTLAFIGLPTVGLTAQTRRALIIGVGQQEDKKWGKINGDKDVPFVEEILRNAKFKAGNIRKLVNRQATKAAIVDAFKSLAIQSKYGDVVYVHFSGHGQQMKDVHNDEKDGLDECWIPYDAYKRPCAKDMGEKHLSDDEIAVLLYSIKKRIGVSGKILVVVDACHSGTATWSFDCKDETMRGTWEVFNLPQPVKYIDNPNKRHESWITISACKDNQSNYELKNKNVGKLTYALYEIVSSNKKFSNKKFEEMLYAFFSNNAGKYQQTPIISGLSSNDLIQEILK